MSRRCLLPLALLAQTLSPSTSFRPPLMGSRRRLRMAADEPAAPEATELSVAVVESVRKVAEADWDACAGEGNPFLRHAFFRALEESGSACRGEGWVPHHLVARDPSDAVVGLVPLYLKSHSMGEYVFDQAWASAYRQMGGFFGETDYYPKLQSCVPFTPATGPRLLVHAGVVEEGGDAQRLMVVEALARGLKAVADQTGVSGLHVTFPTREEWEILGGVGFQQRLGVQYHWRNDGYEDFEAFLATLKASKRKNIRQERRRVAEAGVSIRRLTGADIEPRHWDAFYGFYRKTVDEHWAQDYLKRDFFDMLGDGMADRVMLVMVEEDETGDIVAGALNLVGDDCVYGRNWGCAKQFNSLHFECCYYQAIEYAIEKGLARVEAGAQGEHKIRRGYLPTLTYSAHYHANSPAGYTEAVSRFLEQERTEIYYTLSVLTMQESPFKGDEVFQEHLASQGVTVKGDRIYLTDIRTKNLAG